MFRINCRFFACRDVTEIVWRSVSKSKSFNLQCMKSCNFPRIATFCAYPHDDMREIGVKRQTNQK